MQRLCISAKYSSAELRTSTAPQKIQRSDGSDGTPMPAMGLASWSQDDPKLRGLRGNKGLNCSCPLRFPLTPLPPHPYSPSASTPSGGVRVRGPLMRVRGSPSPSRVPVHAGPPLPSLARISPQLPPEVAGSNGGPIPDQFSNWFYRYCAPPPRTLVIKVCQCPLQVHTVLQMGQQTEPGAVGEFFMHQDPPFGTKGTH